MMRLFIQVFNLPVVFVVATVEAFAHAMQSFQHKMNEEIQDLCRTTVAELGAVNQSDVQAPWPAGQADETSCGCTTVPGNAAPERHHFDSADLLKPEDRRMRDTDLAGKDELKLVRYKILFIKRDYEYAFPEREELVHDEMDDRAFASWKIAEFIQEIGKPPYGAIPKKWKDSAGKPKYPPSGFITSDGKFTGFKDEDKKYLRVYFEVLERYRREEFRHEERQIEVLEEIRDVLEKGKGVKAGP